MWRQSEELPPGYDTEHCTQSNPFKLIHATTKEGEIRQIAFSFKRNASLSKDGGSDQWVGTRYWIFVLGVLMIGLPFVMCWIALVETSRMEICLQPHLAQEARGPGCQGGTPDLTPRLWRYIAWA